MGAEKVQLMVLGLIMDPEEETDPHKIGLGGMEVETMEEIGMVEEICPHKIGLEDMEVEITEGIDMVEEIGVVEVDGIGTENHVEVMEAEEIGVAEVEDEGDMEDEGDTEEVE